MKELAFSVPGTNGPIPIEGVSGMPTSSDVVGSLVQWGLTILLVTAAFVALAFVMWGGISWIMSGGEKEKIEEARKKIVFALIGLILVFLSFFVINTIGGVFGIDPLHFRENATCRHKLVQCPSDPAKAKMIPFCNGKAGQSICPGS